MTIRPVTKNIAVAPQLSAQEIQAAAAQGFCTIINNRPDGEESGQPTSAEMQAAAESCSMTYHHIPVVGGAIDDEQIAAFAKAVSESAGPTLAFCRSGTRSVTLWALQACAHCELPADEAIALAGGAGYDLGGLKPKLEST